MNCRKVEKQFIRYIDNELSQAQKINIETHLRTCKVCSKRLARLSDLIKPEQPIPSIDSPDFLWERIYMKITKPKQETGVLNWLFGEMPRYATVALSCCLFVISAAIGVFLGSYPLDTINGAQSIADQTSVSQELGDDLYLKNFSDLPAGSVGDIYFSLGNEQK